MTSCNLIFIIQLSNLSTLNIKNVFNSRFAKLLAEKKAAFLRRLRAVPTIVKVARTIETGFGPLSARFGRLTVPAMKHPSSPYHKDFIPVFRLLTSIPEEKLVIARGGDISGQE